MQNHQDNAYFFQIRHYYLILYKKKKDNFSFFRLALAVIDNSAHILIGVNPPL